MRRSAWILVVCSLCAIVSTGCPIGNPNQTAAFSFTPSVGATPCSVAFTDLSVPGDAPIVSWLWTFGDGNTELYFIHTTATGIAPSQPTP